MIEILILYILLNNKSTIYGMKKKIETKFSFLVTISFGTIHPALERLQNKGCVDVKKTISKGGKRSSTYFITKKGEEFFKVLMLKKLPINPNLAEQMIKVKLISINKLGENKRNDVIKQIINYYELTAEKLEQKMSNEADAFDYYHKEFVKINIKVAKDKAIWLQQLL